MAPPPRVMTARPFVVSRAEGRFLMARPVSAGTAVRIDFSVVLIWFEELETLAPAG